MAGDWIKMRVNLVTHPKVMAIAEFLADEAEYQEWSTLSGFVPSYGGSNERTLRNERHSALRVTRYVTVCALLHFWGYANEHSREEFIAFMTVDDIDEIVRVPSFGLALQSVGWIECSENPTGIHLPNFAEFNAVADERKSGSKAAERQKRYRDRLKALQGYVTSDVTENVTVTSRNAPREEKNREEPNSSSTKKNSAPRFDAVAYLLSFGVDEKTIVDWLEVRRSKKLKATQTAMEGVVDEARKAGVSVQKAIEMCCKRGWGGFDSSWLPKTNSPPGWHDQNAETIAALTGRSRDHEPDDRTIDV